MPMESRSDQDRWQKHAENKRVPSLHYQQHHSRNDVGGSTNETKAPVDKEKLRAMFYPDSDSDDDPIESIKRRQIAANKRKRELAEANAISKDVGLKRAAVTDNSIHNISSNNEKANENTTFPKRHCTTPQNATITNEGIEPKSSEESLENVFSLCNAIDLTLETNLTTDAASTPKISQLSESGVSSETSTLRQVGSDKEVTIMKNDEGEETLLLENDVANKTKQRANSKAVDLTVDAPAMQQSLTKSDAAVSAQVTPAASTPTNPAETSPITAKEVETPKSVSWTSLHSQHLLVRSPVVFNPRDKVAGFDLDQTLVNWNLPPGSWPSSVQQYELWNSSVIDKMRKLDKDGYKLVIFSNQGGIKGALNGKIAARVKSVIDWIAKKLGRPVFAICSTQIGSEYHKGNSGMWEIMESRCNAGLEVGPDLSFFVGDSDGKGEGYQLKGVDKAFAENVGRLRNVQMKFFTPKEFFGDSNLELRKLTLANSTPPPRPSVPKRAILERTALLGGYVQAPLLLILVGVQGSGKSTFSQSLGQGWCHLSQDTILKGRPGERKGVEAAARSMLEQNQKSVVIDRMHLDAAQRQHFIQIGKEAGVHVHCLVFMASKDEISKRVKQRTNHPGAVEGERGAQLAVSSLSRLVPPTYEEGFTLINYTYTGNAPILDSYRNIGSNETRPMRKSISLGNGGEKDSLQLQMITLGTFKLKKQDVSSPISLATRLGIGIDTAPTYDNEVEIGNSLRSHTANVTVKVPKRAIQPSQAREEVMKSLSSLKLKCADVVLLHWPSDLIDAGTLLPVWKELESMKKEGLCKVLGVCNFSISALQKLIPICSVRPSINQVERHPLLPQYDLLDYCSSVGIVVQAHSPLGGGKLLQGHSTINKIAQESGMSPATALVSWNLQQGVPVVVKSSTSAHLRQIASLLHDNTDNLELSANHMKELSELSLSPGSTTHRFVAPPFMFRPGTVYSWEDATRVEYIEPAIPNAQFSIGSGEEKLPFVLYLAIREKKSTAFSEGITACEASCPPGVHSHCFQRAGTRHITLFQGDLTRNQARMLRYKQDHTTSDVSLPMNIDFDSWMSWEAGCYLSVEQSSRRKLESLVGKIVGLPQGPRKCDHAHLSLYRSRKFPYWQEFRAAVGRIKHTTNNQNWGSVEGVSIRLKIMQDPYEDCVVLAGSAGTIDSS